MEYKGRVGIVYPFDCLGTIPSIVNAASLLGDSGYLVDVFTPTVENPWVGPRGGRISVLPISFPRRPGLLGLFRHAIVWLKWMFRVLVRHWQVPYRCIIGVDPQGLMRAWTVLVRWMRVPLAYYSLELLLSHELTTEDQRKEKAQERTLARRAVFVVIQDDERATLLERDNQLPSERVLCVPNAPLGPANPEQSDYLRQKLSIPPGMRIILYSGMLAPWACVHELVLSTHAWPDDWVLVCHSRYAAGGSNRDYVATLEELADLGRVVFSRQPLPEEEYAAAVRSADVGVACYCAISGSTYTQDNLRHVGLSSGKLAYYLRAGVPVLVSDQPSLRRLVTTYRCGEVTTDPTATRDPIERVFSDYETYRRNAVTCFEREFDFVGRFSRVIARIDQL